MDNIFFSFSFSEFKPLVEHLTKRISESVILQKSGLHPHHLAQLEAYKNSPLENSLLHVSNSRYMVCLLGQNAGSEVRDGKTYIELEIEEAIENDVDVFAFLVGESYAHSEAIPDNISRIYDSLSSYVTVGRIPSDDHEFIARTIIRALEADVWQALGEDETFTISNDLLNVSGFPREYLNKLSKEISRQLARIYELDKSKSMESPLSSDLAQRKNWAYESLSYGHTEEAIKNLQKVVEEFGSDFFSCFWLGRIYAINSTRDERLKKSFVLNELALSMLNDEDTLLCSLCHTHMAIAAGKLGDIAVAQSHFEKSVETFKTYDACEYWAELCLQQMQISKTGSWAQDATNCLAVIQKSKLAHFLQVCSRFEEEYGESFSEVNKRLFDKWNAFLRATHTSASEDQSWVSSQFNYKLRKLRTINASENSLESALFVSQLIWQNYRALRHASEGIFNRYCDLQVKKDELELHTENYSSEEVDALEFIEQSHEIVSTREDAREKVDTLQPKLKQAKNKLLLANIVSVITLGGLTVALLGLIGSVPAINFALIVILIAILLVRQKQAVTVQTFEEEVNTQTQLTGALSNTLFDLWDEAESRNQDDFLRIVFSKLKTEPDEVRSEDLDRARKEISRRTAELDQSQVVESNNIQSGLFELKQLIKTWYNRVDKFEQYAVSAHNGQYNHLLSKKGQVSVTRKIELGSDSLSSVNDVQDTDETNYKGRAIHIGGSRLKAWFDDADAALNMLNDLNSTNSSKSVQADCV